MPPTSPSGGRSVRHVVQVQDNAREAQLRDLFALSNPQGDKRIGHDAELVVDDRLMLFELKTTTKDQVATSHHLGPKTIAGWRDAKLHWICAKGVNLSDGFRFDEVFYLSPAAMEPWYAEQDAYFRRKRQPWEKAKAALLAAEFDLIELATLDATFESGIVRNNPGIPWKYIMKHGVAITEDHAAALLSILSGSQSSPPPAKRHQLTLFD
jgi:hypothetical protein